MRKIDETGKKFNKLTFVEYDSYKNRKTYWKCRCDCGNICIVESSNVKNGNTKSCGCLKQKREDVTNKRFARLVAIKFEYMDKHYRAYWLCKCDCGNEIIILLQSMKNGRTKSCGCLHKEIISNRTGENNPNWNHNLSKVDRIELENDRILFPKYIKWRKKVYKRDNYTCQCCYKKSKNIEAHHLYSYHSHKSLRYVVTNGVTLCEACHKTFHSEFGYKNNTRKQFNKFKRSKTSENKSI